MHWSIVRVAALAAGSGRANPAMEKALINRTRAATDAMPRRTRRAVAICV